jgi:hypothetical protein
MNAKILALLLASASISSAQTGVRILLGMTDKQPTKWDGSVRARGTEVRSIEPWRFDGGDSLQGSGWKLSTHPARLFNAGSQIGLASVPLVPNGVIVRIASAAPDAQLDVETAQGNFSVRLSDIGFGKVTHPLDGRARVDLVPPADQITNDREEQDYPVAAAAPDGTVWLAYAEFKHHKDHDRLRANLTAAPADFAAYKQPTGGDRVLARSLRNGSWSAPIEISPAGGDIYRPAIAIDGAGKPWVFWSQNEKSNFDLWARPIEDGRPGKAVRLSAEAGADMDPVAATDSKGKVWVAWQAWRNGKASIVAASQAGAGFTPAKPVALSSGNQWDPAIACDANGRVTIAWDAYDNGNYDVMMRTATNGAWGKVVAAAATARYEAYPSIAYDSGGRLWMAYEEGAEGWGKDFGAYSSTGTALYQGRAIRLRGFEHDGRTVKTSTDPGALMHGAMSLVLDKGHQNDSDAWIASDARRAQDRAANRATANVPAPRNTSPRLGFDKSGRMWLVYRSVNPIWWNPLGTVWFEYAMSYDGAQWTGPIFLTHSDNLLDNRPTLVSTTAGQMMVIGSADSRSQFHLALSHGSQEQNASVATFVGMPTEDPYNNDLYANTIVLGPGRGSLTTAAEQSEPAPAVAPEIQAERAAIARMRAYRTRYGGQTLRLARGEFHRHSEISMDGGQDGSILDQWRYVIDAVALDWVGCCDHDNGGGREYTWWLTQKQTDLFYAPGRFAPIFNYERSVAYPEGHRNVLFVQRGVRPLPRLPKMAEDSTGKAPDTLMLFRYLKEFHGVAASHTSATVMGTDWRDNDPEVETSVEIYQGDRQNYEKPGSPRTSTDKDSIGGYRPKGYVDRALDMGYRMAFEASSDHVSTHMSFGNVLTTAVTREAILEGFRKRHLYGSTDNILAEFRSGDHIMGDEFSTAQAPAFEIHLTGTAKMAKVVIVKDGQYVYSQEPNQADVKFTWRDNSPKAGKASYYYVRGEQSDGEIVWVSPMWITYTGK